MLRYARSLACRAVAEALGEPAGPVHLNWPLREPLEPLNQSESEQLDAHERSRAGASWRPRNTAERAAPASRGRLGENDDVLGPLAEAAHASERGVIVCGPLPAEPGLADAVVELGRTLGWPITADPTSQLRSGSHCHDAPLCAHADLLLRDERFATAHAPDVVLRIGDMPVTKSLRLWLEAAPPGELWLVDPDGERNDPSHLSTRVLRADPAELCRDLAARFGAPRKSAWLDDFLAADRRIGQAVRRASEDAPILLEPRITQVLLDQLPDGACLYVSSSMPIRDVDAFMSQGTKAIEVHANRGANGIDGVVSSAVGAAAHGGGPVVLLIGDLALLHDIGGLLAAKVHHIPLTIVVLNNDGGGIFSFLPIAAQGRAVEFEKLFQTPHGVTFEAAAALYDARYTRVTDEPGLRDALDSSLVSPEGVHIIEVPVEGDANVEHFRVLVGVAAQAIDAQASR
jgi:2-succinyl-5-enolpyruvyl-6-hydroxy-3-cyclohexene-1-carboxylate synthase